VEHVDSTPVDDFHPRWTRVVARPWSGCPPYRTHRRSCPVSSWVLGRTHQESRRWPHPLADPSDYPKPHPAKERSQARSHELPTAAEKQGNPGHVVQGSQSGGGTAVTSAPMCCDGHRPCSEAVRDRLSRQPDQPGRYLYRGTVPAAGGDGAWSRSTAHSGDPRPAGVEMPDAHPGADVAKTADAPRGVVLALPTRDRARIATELLLSLDSETVDDAEIDDLWSAETQRRAAWRGPEPRVDCNAAAWSVTAVRRPGRRP